MNTSSGDNIDSVSLPTFFLYRIVTQHFNFSKKKIIKSSYNFLYRLSILFFFFICHDDGKKKFSHEKNLKKKSL